MALREAVTANADRFAADRLEVVADIQGTGHSSLRAIATELMPRGIKTRRGGKWQVSNVKGLLGKLDEA